MVAPLALLRLVYDREKKPPTCGLPFREKKGSMMRLARGIHWCWEIVSSLPSVTTTTPALSRPVLARWLASTQVSESRGRFEGSCCLAGAWPGEVRSRAVQP